MAEQKYKLPSEDDPEDILMVASDDPPSYSSITNDFIGLDIGTFPKLPSYAVATTLPTYEESQRSSHCPSKTDEELLRGKEFEDPMKIEPHIIFMLTFFIAFLFNWMGFLFCFLLTSSPAGRYGSISGFGLSVIEWFLLIRFTPFFPGYIEGPEWLWAVFVVIGFFLFIRGIIGYFLIRKPRQISALLPSRSIFDY